MKLDSRTALHAEFIPGSVTGTVGHNTPLLDVETASLAIGKDLLCDRKPIKSGPCRVLVLSLEDYIGEWHQVQQELVNATAEYDPDIVDVAVSNRGVGGVEPPGGGRGGRCSWGTPPDLQEGIFRGWGAYRTEPPPVDGLGKPVSVSKKGGEFDGTQ